MLNLFIHTSIILSLLSSFLNSSTFTNVWDTLFNELHEIIKIHTFFIAKISEEVEVPLREKATSDPEWSQLKYV
jgi:hypothetical protein